MKPFIKWAGGKTQLLEEIRPYIPSQYNCYYEPFLGGGALFFDVAPKKAFVSDANEQLIDAYINIRDNLQILIDSLRKLDSVSCSDQFYYDIRNRYNEKIEKKDHDVMTTAYLIWLNHHCFNGLYRTNKKGGFNTPWNKDTEIKPSFDEKNLTDISNYLNENEIVIQCADYQDALKLPEEGDFVFLDPPYVPVGKYGDFKRYTKDQFYESDQRRLSDIVSEMRKKGVMVCLTNSNTELVKELYANFKIQVIKTHRNVNSKGNHRFGEDAIITA